MRVSLITIEFLFLYLFTSNCGSPVEPPQAHGELMPMEAGNFWHYHYFYPEIGRVAYIQINSITERPLDRLYLTSYELR